MTILSTDSLSIFSEVRHWPTIPEAAPEAITRSTQLRADQVNPKQFLLKHKRTRYHAILNDFVE
jgi:hypothetical protein